MKMCGRNHLGENTQGRENMDFQVAKARLTSVWGTAADRVIKPGLFTILEDAGHRDTRFSWQTDIYEGMDHVYLF